MIEECGYEKGMGGCMCNLNPVKKSSQKDLSISDQDCIEMGDEYYNITNSDYCNKVWVYTDGVDGGLQPIVFPDKLYLKPADEDYYNLMALRNM